MKKTELFGVGMRSLTILLLLFIFHFSTHAQTGKVIAGISIDRLQRYEDYVKREVDEGRIPGAVSLIARNGEIVYSSASGVSSVSRKRKMKTDDIFFIQSMTKPIINVALMMLYEEGHFQLNDPISKYLPAFKDIRVLKNPDDGLKGETVALKRAITIADLMTHTAGFSHGISQSRYDKEMGPELFKSYSTVQERVNKLASFPLLGHPGEQWVYSAAPDILSVLIEKFSGKSTDQFLRERVFKPLDMKDTGYNLTKAQQDRVVQVHEKANGALANTSQQPKPEGNTLWSGVNALFSTAEDYMHFCQMLLNGGRWNNNQLLSPKTVQLMTMNHSGDLFQTPGEGFGYGFAVVDDVASTNNQGSNGLFYWAGAFNTHFFVDPQEKLIAVFMTQTSAFDSYYHAKLRQLVYQAIVD